MLVTVDGGGFLWQSLVVARSLHAHFDVHLVSAISRKSLVGHSIPGVPIHEMARATRLGEQRWMPRLVRFARSLRDARRLLAAIRPDAVVCTASSIAVPLFIAARMSGATTIFIESITRVSQPSATGRLVNAFGLCDRFYVQWPEATSQFRKAVHAGTLL